MRARQSRSEVNYLVRNKKANFIRNKLDQNKGNHERFWQTIRQIVPSSKSNHESISLLNLDNNVEVPSNCIPDHINNFFAEIGPKLAENLNGNWLPSTQLLPALFD